MRHEYYEDVAFLAALGKALTLPDDEETIVIMIPKVQVNLPSC
jgi:hypothetical protein